MAKLFAITLLLISAGIANAQDNSAAPDYFVEAAVDQPNPFVGQQFTYRFTFYDATDHPNPLYEAPEFEGLWRVDRPPQNQRIEQLNNRQYRITTVETTLFATQTGSLTISPGKIILPETVFASQQELLSQPVTIEVQPLPTGAPTGFNSAVGQFEISATISTSETTVGEPVELVLTVTGTGNLEQLPAPTLDLPAGWRSYDARTGYEIVNTDPQLVGRQRYSFLLVSESPGNYTLPAQNFVYFEPQNGVYQTLSTAPVPVSILAVANNGVVPVLPVSGVKLRSISTTSSNALNNIPLLMLWLLPPLSFGFYQLKNWRQKRLLRLNASSADQEILKTVLKKLQAAERMNPQQAQQIIREAITVYLNRVEAISSTHTKQLTQIRDWLYESRYMPNADKFDIQGTIHQTREVIRSIESQHSEK